MADEVKPPFDQLKIGVKAQIPPHKRIEHELKLIHMNSREEVCTLFGHNPENHIPKDARYLLSIVSESEAKFTAEYLDIPQENIILVKRGKRLRADKICQALENSNLPNQTNSSVTFLGHMTPEGFGGMDASDLANACLDGEVYPRRTNFFACSSKKYSAAFVEAMANPNPHCYKDRVSHRIMEGVAVEEEQEISQWPKVYKRGKPHQFFYGGPEISLYTKVFSRDKHGGILQYLTSFESFLEANNVQSIKGKA